MNQTDSAFFTHSRFMFIACLLTTVAACSQKSSETSISSSDSLQRVFGACSLPSGSSTKAYLLVNGNRIEMTKSSDGESATLNQVLVVNSEVTIEVIASLGGQEITIARATRRVDDSGVLNFHDTDFELLDNNNNGIPNCVGSVTAPSNPDNIDVNEDGLLNDEDDWNSDGTVNQTDRVTFVLDSMNPQSGTVSVDCIASDCASANANWNDNTPISQIRSPVSSYALGIQRILYCLNFGGQETGTTIESYADGVFGPSTDADVKSYQTDKSLLADGVVGPQTWESLQSDLHGPFNFDDQYIYWEVASAREGCKDRTLFFQRKSAPMDWWQARVPDSTDKIGFTIINAN